MRTSVIMVLIGALGVFLGMVALGFGVLVWHSGGKFWFYWIAPLLALAVGLGVAGMSAAYYVKVGRLELKGRPRSD